MALTIKAGKYVPLMLLLTLPIFLQYTATSYVRRYSRICDDALLFTREAVPSHGKTPCCVPMPGTSIQERERRDMHLRSTATPLQKSYAGILQKSYSSNCAAGVALGNRPMGSQSKTFPGILRVSDKIAARASQVNSCKRHICFLVLRCSYGASIEEWVGLK